MGHARNLLAYIVVRKLFTYNGVTNSQSNAIIYTALTQKANTM